MLKDSCQGKPLKMTIFVPEFICPTDGAKWLSPIECVRVPPRRGLLVVVGRPSVIELRIPNFLSLRPFPRHKRDLRAVASPLRLTDKFRKLNQVSREY